MIKIIDIQNYIVKMLSERFPGYAIYKEDNRKDHIRPAFYISVRPLVSMGAMDYKNEVVNVDIRYLSENQTNEENLIMADKLKDTLNLILKVKNRRLYIGDLSTSTQDTVLNVGFTLDYNVGVTTKYDADKDKDAGYTEESTKNMKELEMTREDDNLWH